jgi:ubiquinone/menaquinone biosynthesis C-methylase UbiE
VLVANTYHELSNPKAILNHVFRSLVPGGRLVVIDRGPTSMNVPHRERDDHYHQLPAATVERELLQSGFEVIRRQDHFIEQPVEESWWLIVARKP